MDLDMVCRKKLQYLLNLHENKRFMGHIAQMRSSSCLKKSFNKAIIIPTLWLLIPSIYKQIILMYTVHVYTKKFPFHISMYHSGVDAEV